MARAPVRSAAACTPDSGQTKPDVFAKLNLKDQREILVLNAPPSFEPALQALHDVRVRRSLPRGGAVGFALAFVMRQGQVDALAQALSVREPADMVLWFAYPKGTSKRYSCEFNRDSGWQTLRRAGFDSVRQIAIDADWTALRFRREQFIKR